MSGREVKTHPGKLSSANEFSQMSASSHISSLFCIDTPISLAAGKEEEDVTIPRALEVSSGFIPDAVKDVNGSD